jgi:hypothetical protein
MRVYIGEFTMQDLKDGVDKVAIAEALEKDSNKRNGIKYIESEYIKDRQVMKVWLTDKF